MKRIGAGGFGVGILPEGKVVFIPRTAPGDKARIQVVKEKARWARGEVVELLHEGPGRREAPCPMYASCDGCSLQHLEYGEQLRWKSHLVGDTLRRLGKVEIDDPEVVPSPRELHYRNRVSYTLRRLTGGRLVAGFRELGHRGRVLDLRGQCLLPEDPLPAAWERIRQEWGPRGARLPRGRQLRLTLQKGVDGVGLMVRGGEGRGEPEVLLDRVEELVSVWHRKKGEDPLLLAGEPVMRVSWGQEVIDLEGGAFVQVNAGIGTGLYEYVLREIGDPVGRTIIDAYCGPAILGRSLSRKGGEVTGIDAVHGGAPGGDPADPRGFRYVVGRVEKELKRLLPADLVLLNPPRSGLHSSIPATLLAKPPRTVVYVSCDPATLARDLKRLESGYRVTRLRAYDLFPQTGHVETVVTLKGITEDRQ
ncbi:MAG: TRAM domain-containing protein [Gemmatimonadota bacterium]